ANGWFDTGDALEELAELVVVNVGGDQSTHEVPRERWTRLGNGWRVPLSIGPTFRLSFVGDEAADTRDWEARLCSADDPRAVWYTARKGPPPYLRYDAPVHGSGECWLEARSKDGLFEGRGNVDSLIGIHEVEIVLRECAVVCGRVVDASGAPWRDVPIDAAHFTTDDVERFRVRTGSDGSYQLGARDPGRMRFLLSPPQDTRVRRLDLEVPRGLTRVPDIVLERRSAGSVRGVLRSRDGTRPVVGTLRLRALDGSGYELSQYFAFGAGRVIATGIQGDKSWDEYSSAQDTLEFRFQDVPPGRFELSVASHQGYACSHDSIEVQAPADGLVFLFENAVELRPYYFELVDVETGKALAEPVAEVWISGAKSAIRLGSRSDRRPEMADGVRFEWTAFHPGYRMERGTERDFVLEEGAMVARRGLRHGLGLRLELRDYDLGPERWDERDPRWEASGVAGAEILADGAVVATSDQDGIAELDLPQVPE